jgi:cation-dependent mannose-6-phosphate receptor
MAVILTASCARFIPGMSTFGRGRGGYSRVSTSGMNGGTGGRHSDDENRLIDQLDEEWDD